MSKFPTRFHCGCIFAVQLKGILMDRGALVKHGYLSQQNSIAATVCSSLKAFVVCRMQSNSMAQVQSDAEILINIATQVNVILDICNFPYIEVMTIDFSYPVDCGSPYMFKIRLWSAVVLFLSCTRQYNLILDRILEQIFLHPYFVFQ